MSTWGFGNLPPAGGNHANNHHAAADAGANLPELESEDLALVDVATQPGERVKVSEPWSPPPPPHASLVSVASQKGLLAVAGPDSLVIASTSSVYAQYVPRRLKTSDKRKFDGWQEGQDGQPVTEAEPQHLPINAAVRIPVPRLSHVAFSSDESCLVIVAENGGGLAVYDTNALASGSKDPAFQIATNNASVRHLAPNPNPAGEYAHFFAVVLTNGQLLVADLQAKSLADGPNGKLFYDKVCSVTWSKMGKRMLAGLEDSTCVQIDPAGAVKDQIPIPPRLVTIQQEEYESAQAFPVTSISWLQTNQFLLVYTPFNKPANPDDMQPRNDSVYFLAEREKADQSLIFRQFQIDPCAAFGNEYRVPANHFLARLPEWEPEIADMVIASSTASTDIGIFAKFTNRDSFVTVTIQNEGRRAALPMSGGGTSDTSPIGMALDFSSKVVAPRPIPSQSDTIENSPHPLPSLVLVNTEGLLCMWWVIYPDSIRQKKPHRSIVHKDAQYTTYKQLSKVAPVVIKEPGAPSETAAPKPPASMPAPSFDAPAQTPKPAFGGTSALGGGKASVWGTPSTSTKDRATVFGQSTPVGMGAGKPAFGTPSQPAFGHPSQLASTGGAAFGQASGFGKAAQLGGGSAFGQIGAMGAKLPWAAKTESGDAKPAPFASFATKAPASPFASAAGAQNPSASPFASAGQTNSFPFAKMGQTNQSPFSSAAQTNQSLFGNTSSNQGTSSFSSFGKPSFSNQTSTGSTATIGSGGTFGSGASFGKTPELSKESSVNDGNQSSGFSGFKLGSTFKGDGTAKDDLPKPANPGASLFGEGFGKSLGDAAASKGPEIKREPGTEKESALQDIPAAKSRISPGGDAPLPPDPSVFDYKKKLADMGPIPGIPDKKEETLAGDAPLPPDPSTFNYKKTLANMPPIPDAEKTTPPRKDERDIPIAGSPPQDITHSQTFSPTASEAGPSDEWDEDAEGEEDEESDEDDAEEDGEEDDDDEEGFSDVDEDEEDEDEDGEAGSEEQEPYVVQDQKGLDSFLARMGPKSTTASTAPKSPDAKPKTKTPPKSYTPVGFPKGPVLAPGGARKTEQSPRSPSPQRQPPQLRSVTSPVHQTAPKGELKMPPQIRVSAVPPAKPVQREKPTAPVKPREPTAGELADENDARIKELLAQPIEPSRDMPPFYTHQDYTGTAETPGVGGHIERVFRDVNSMVDVVGLNARSLMSFIEGQEKLRNPGQRTREDLETPDAWTLGDIGELSRVMDGIGSQLEHGKLDRVKDKLSILAHGYQEVLKLKAAMIEMKRQIQAHTDPQRRAEQDMAPLPAETAARLNELRQGVMNVQKLLSEAEEKMSLLRADLASIRTDVPNGSKAPVPTVEAVERTILKMTAMVEQKSGDIDVLEAHIKRLPNGPASLRMADDYEDDLAACLGGSKLLTHSPSRRTPQKHPRMTASGDPLGMSGMFGSKFRTPPSASVRGSPSMRASVLARSTGSAILRQSTGSQGGSGSARKKMVDVTEDEVESWNARQARRREVLQVLKGKVEDVGARVVKVE